jgi:hypothetical protein
MKERSELPDWVAQHKRPGTEIRLISGKYYLYQISSQWDVALKRSKKKTGAYLGRITSQGFKPKKTEQSLDDNSQISVRHFGAVHYFEQRSGTIPRWHIVFSHPKKQKNTIAGSVVSRPATAISLSPDNMLKNKYLR